MTIVVDEAELRAMVNAPASFNLRPSIQTAILMVGEDLSDKGLSESRLNTIATFLAAHFTILTTETGGLASQKVGDAEDSYQRPFGEALSATRFGQQVLLLDSSGTFAAMSKGAKSLRAEFRVL